MSVVQYYGRPGPGISASYRMNYAVNSYFPSRKPRPNSLKGSKTLKKDIKETIQHAALINIVAAVNENLHRHTTPRQTSSSSARSTINVIPHVIFPHEKTVSIPQAKQKIFNMPDEIVQRKPVYYKHSADLEVSSNSHIRFYDESVSFDQKIQKQNRKIPAKELIKSLPDKPKILDINFQDPVKNRIQENNKNHTQNEYKVRIASSVRRLGCVKKSAPREIYELPKCDAIDIQDTKTVINDEAQSDLDESKSVIPLFTQTKIPYIRTKSLPVMFPRKTSNSLKATETPSLQKQPSIFKDRPLSQSLRKQTPDSMYTRINHLPGGFGYGGMTINNGMNQAPDVSGILIHDSEKSLHARGSLSSNSRLRLTRTLRSPSSPTIGRGNGNFTSVQNEFHSKNTQRANIRTYTNKNDLHEAVRSAMSGRVERAKYYDDSKRIPSSARSRKSCLTSKSGLSETPSGNQATKKVQFISSDSSLNDSVQTNSLKDEKSEHFDIRGGSSVLQAPTPTSVLRSFSPAIQPMSVRELLRLEQKILPANSQPPPADNLQEYFATNSLLSVHTLLRNDSNIAEKTRTSVDKNTDKDDSVDINKDIKLKDNEAHCNVNDIDNDQYISEDDSEFRGFSDSNDNDDEDNDDDDNDTEGFYKLVKAFDKQPYEGFEHKKIRRASASSKSKDTETDNKKAHYVKVRLG